jgi:ABC-type branched-subunit amino acid transport system substrate-binding protein
VAVAAVAHLMFVAVACGARVTPEQVTAAAGGQSGVGGSSGNAAPSNLDTASTSPMQPTQTIGATGVSRGGPSAAGAAPATGDNGGATDIGVTGDTMTLGTVATLSGPVPGVFQGAVIGTLAAVAQQNADGGMYGRKFKLDVRDDSLDSGQNRAQTIDLLSTAFAFVGSFSSYDDAAAAQIERSGLPDVSVSLTPGRRSLSNNFSISPYPSPGAPTGSFTYFKQRFPEAVQSVGSIYYDIAKGNQDDTKAAAESVGWHFSYNRGIQATETDFTADVVRMRQAGVKAVYLSAVDVKAVARLAKAMAQQNFKPTFTLVGGVGYDPSIVALAGDAVEGFFNSQPFSMFVGEDAATIPEVRLFGEWIQKVKPGYKPDLFAAYGWASGRLFFQALRAAGPTATRATVVRELRKIDDFSANGFLAPAGPGTKRPATCYLIVQIKGGKFTRFDSPDTGYRCGDGGFFARA